jgi:AhpD family alkylhydroperoxidase
MWNMTTKNPVVRAALWLFGILLLAITGSAAADTRAPTEAQNARDDIGKTLGFVPGFFKVTADVALPGAWQEMKGLQLNPKTALSGRTKELIGLAVASQIPCRYCIYAHTAFAELNGAGEAEIAEAVAVAGVERHWSAYLYGMQIDEGKFKSDVQKLVQNAKTPSPRGPSIAVVDGKTALSDIQQTFGFVPDFLRSVPEAALPGAWREMKDVKLGATALPAKVKSLISLAVASQVPSRPCVVAETEFAKLGGANEQEIGEAVGMAALTRNLSTLLNGQQIDEAAFRADIDRLVAGVKAAQRKVSAGTH